MRVETKANYLLWLNFDKYAGNFERELIGYIMGFIDDEQEEYCTDSYGSEGPWVAEYEKDTGRDFDKAREYWDEWIQETYQYVDDWKQMTFYNIAGRNGKVNSLYIQFYKEPSEEIIKNLLERISKWEDNFHIISNEHAKNTLGRAYDDYFIKEKREDTPMLLSAELENTKEGTSIFVFKREIK